MNTLETVTDKIETILKEKLFHPRLQGKALDETIHRFAAQCKQNGSQDLVSHVNQSLQILDVSNTSFWATPAQMLTPQYALNATLKFYLDGTREVWVFTDVLAGGLAARAGIQAGETLLAVDNKAVQTAPKFELGKTYQLTLLTRDGRTERTLSIDLTGGTAKNCPPRVEPQALDLSMVKPEVGLLRVASFPAIIGFDFARQLTSMMKTLDRERCNRLIVDLRANYGGGLGSLRLMSFFTPDKLEVGYSLTRQARDAGTKPSALPVIDRIPHTKPGLYLMALKFKVLNRGRSLRLITERLGRFPFQGKIAILVDEFTKNGSEIVAAFAQRHHLATVVGSQTPGESLGAANFRIEESYRLRIPLVGWYLPDGEMLEGKGITPDVEKAPTLEGLRNGKDEVLETAVALLG